MRSAFGSFALLSLSVVFCPRGQATDWPQFLGPSLNLATPDEAPGPWSTNGPRVVWRVPLAAGYGSLAVVQGVVYTLTTNGCVALEARTGRQLWLTDAGVGLAYSTPSVHDGRVFVYGTTGVLSCLNASNGLVIWSQVVADHVVNPNPLIQNSLSPLVEEGRVFVFHQGQTNCALAFNATNGALLWKAQDCRLTYASPTMGTFGGVRQLIYGAQGRLVGLSPSDGSLLWQRSTAQQYLTPTVHNESLLCPEGLRGVLNVIYTNGSWSVSPAWLSASFTTQWTPPVAAGDCIYEILGGPLGCVDLRTGALLWSTNGFGWGAVVRAGGRLVVLAENGRLELVEPSPLSYRVVSRFQTLTNSCFNLPVVSEGRIYARNDKECVCIDTNPPAELRLGICNIGNGTCQLEVTTVDGSMLDPGRANRIVLTATSNLSSWSAGWSPVDLPGCYTNGVLRYQDIPVVTTTFFRVAETRPNQP